VVSAYLSEGVEGGIDCRRTFSGSRGRPYMTNAGIVRGQRTDGDLVPADHDDGEIVAERDALVRCDQCLGLEGLIAATCQK
jgi:hypothetical protein